MKTIGFIGFGRVVEWHLTCLSPVTGLKIVFVCDISQERREAALASLPNVEVFESVEDLSQSRLYTCTDYIIIATPTGSHFEIANKVLQSSQATLLIEKPTFLRLRDFEQLEKFSKRIIPIFQNRFNPAVLKANQILRSLNCEISHASLAVDWCRPQRYYDLANWRGTWRSDGGVSTNQGIHYFDIARVLLGDFYKVQCHMKRRLVNIECEDYMSAYIELSTGVPLDVRMTTCLRHSKETASLAIHADIGTIYLGGICCNEVKFVSADDEICKSFCYAESVVMPYGNGHAALYNELADGNLESLSTLADSKLTMKYIHACYESAITGHMVDSNSSYENSCLGEDMTVITEFS